MGLRIVCGGRWTRDGRWVVINRHGEIVYDEGGSLTNPLINANVGQAFVDLADCRYFIQYRAKDLLDNDGRRVYL